MEVVVTAGLLELYKSCKAAAKSSPPTNQHPVFYRPHGLSVAQPTVSKHWRENITFHELAYPKLTWGSSDFVFGQWPLIAPGYLEAVYHASHQPSDASTPTTRGVNVITILKQAMLYWGHYSMPPPTASGDTRFLLDFRVGKSVVYLKSSDVNKDWTCKEKNKDLTHKDQDKDKNFTYSYLLQVAAKPTIAIEQQQWTQSENSQHMTVQPDQSAIPRIKTD